MSEEKKLTKYDLKMQKRAEEKAKEAKSEKIWTVVGIAFVLCLVALIAYFPIHSYRSIHKTMFTVGDAEISKVEFDYYYNIYKTNYLDNYGSYLSYYGLDADADMSTLSYSDTMSFQDYFEEQTVEQLKQNYGLIAEAKANGFTYDTDEDFESFKTGIESAAKSAGSSLKAYVQSLYGDYATVERLEPVLRNASLANAYYNHVYEEKAPSADEITAYYEANKSSYDSVDYYMESVSAVLPTEPTELADEGATVAEDGTYTPSDAEKEAAMAVAKEEADALVSSIMTSGTAYVGQKSEDVNYYIRSWLFDEERQPGDTTVIEYSYSNLYYVVGFASRYLDETPTADMRVIVTQEDNGAELIAEYEAGEKTEESFIEMVKKYSIVDSSAEKGGLFEKQSSSDMSDAMKEWFAEPHQKGDVTSFFLSDTYTYVVYYIGENDPAWMGDVTDDIMGETMEAYLADISATQTVSDPDNNLAFIAIRAQEEADAAAAAEAAAQTTTDGTTDTTTDTSAQ